mgnify:CR=1 FL=1
MKKIITFICQILFTFLLFANDRPIITNINAKFTKNNKIVISWSVPENPAPKISKLLVYRSTRPISAFSDIEDESPIATLNPTDSSWTDKVTSYNDFYYAVITVVEDKEYDIILPSINATVSGTRLKLPTNKTQKDTTASSKEKLYPVGTMRETPLPFLDIIENQNKKKLNMSDQAKAVAKNLKEKKQTAEHTVLIPYIFEEDLISPDGGDDFLLFEILRNNFIQKKYSDSVIQLKKLLGTNRSEKVTNRARFYLGQSYYFQENYQDAVKNFLPVYDVYPELAKKWIDSSLDLMEVPLSEN